MGDLATAPVSRDGGEELLPLESQQSRLSRGPHRRRAGDVVEEGDLAEGFAWALLAAEGSVFEHLDLSLLDQEEAVARLALDDHVLVGTGLDREEVVAEPLQGRDRQRREDRVPAQQQVGTLGNRGADL